MMTLARACLVSAALAGWLAATGCGPTERERVEAVAAMAVTNPAGARAEIIKQFNGKTLTIDECMNVAHERLDLGGTSATLALPFASATLEAASALESAIVKAGVTEFYWFRMGTLAGKAAAVAFDAGDVATARALVLGGPRRWQEENYWRFHPEHDAAASWILHRAGESNAAVQRLRSRPDLDEHALAVLDRIEAEVAATSAAKARAKKK